MPGPGAGAPPPAGGGGVSPPPPPPPQAVNNTEREASAAERRVSFIGSGLHRSPGGRGWAGSSCRRDRTCAPAAEHDDSVTAGKAPCPSEQRFTNRRRPCASAPSTVTASTRRSPRRSARPRGCGSPRCDRRTVRRPVTPDRHGPARFDDLRLVSRTGARPGFLLSARVYIIYIVAHTAQEPVRASSDGGTRTAVGSMPNMRLCVRARCAESAKPASWAASVHEAPAAADSMATLMRCQST